MQSEWEFVTEGPPTVYGGLAAEAAGASSSRAFSSQQPVSAPPGPPPEETLSLKEIYEDAWEQARELLQDADPRSDQNESDELIRVCRQMAQAAVQEELDCRRQRTENPTSQETVPEPPREVPQVKVSRRRRDEEGDASTKSPLPPTGPPPPTPTPPKPQREAGARWQALVLEIQQRKRWAVRGHLLNYAKHGCPKNMDRPARGFGKHVGRWGWRAMCHVW